MERINEKWLRRFMDMAELVASWSKDPSSQVGSVIVDDMKRVVSCGYNGFPAGVGDSAERYEDRSIKYLLVRHAEANAISFAKGELRGTTLFATMFPCCSCAGMIIQSGIKRVVSLPLSEDYLSRWGEQVDWSLTMFKEAGVEVMWLFSDYVVIEPK